MKLYATALLLLVSTYALSQDSTGLLTSGRVDWSYIYNGSGNNLPYVEIVMSGPDSGKIIISGDTTKAIMLLVAKIKELQESKNDLYTLIGVGVLFSNTVPDRFKDPKTSKAWARYWKLLKKQGYVMTKKSNL